VATTLESSKKRARVVTPLADQAHYEILALSLGVAVPKTVRWHDPDESSRSVGAA